MARNDLEEFVKSIKETPRLTGPYAGNGYVADARQRCIVKNTHLPRGYALSELEYHSPPLLDNYNPEEFSIKGFLSVKEGDKLHPVARRILETSENLDQNKERKIKLGKIFRGNVDFVGIWRSSDLKSIKLYVSSGDDSFKVHYQEPDVFTSYPKLEGSGRGQFAYLNRILCEMGNPSIHLTISEEEIYKRIVEANIPFGFPETGAVPGFGVTIGIHPATIENINQIVGKDILDEGLAEGCRLEEIERRYLPGEKELGKPLEDLFNIWSRVKDESMYLCADFEPETLAQIKEIDDRSIVNNFRLENRIDLGKSGEMSTSVSVSQHKPGSGGHIFFKVDTRDPVLLSSQSQALELAGVRFDSTNLGERLENEFQRFDVDWDSVERLEAIFAENRRRRGEDF
jgi:hypothetical protein